MTKSIRTFRRIILPSVILVPLLWLMIGCFVIPTFDHAILTGADRDFRKWSDDRRFAEPPDLKMFTRSGIESMFGKPPFVSRSGTCVAYTMDSWNGIAVVPLCFWAGTANNETHVLKLVFDDDGRLNHVVPLTGSPDSPENLIRDRNAFCPANEVIEMPDSPQNTMFGEKVISPRNLVK